MTKKTSAEEFEAGRLAAVRIASYQGKKIDDADAEKLKNCDDDEDDDDGEDSADSGDDDESKKAKKSKAKADDDGGDDEAKAFKAGRKMAAAFIKGGYIGG